jgi:hypothetical protein
MAINFLNITETLVEARINDNTVGSNLPTPRLAFKENGVVSGGISTTGGNLILETSSGTERVRITTTGNAVFAGDISLADGKKLQLGAANDLQIYHDGSNSYINDTGTGNLNINATNLALNNGAGTKTYILATDGGSVQLRHNDSTKLESTSTGITVTGVAKIQYNGVGLDVENTASNGADTGIRIRGARNGQSFASGNLTSYALFSNYDDNTTPNNYDLAKIGAGMYDASADTGYFRIMTNNGTAMTKALDIDKSQNALFYANVGIGGSPATVTHNPHLDIVGNRGTLTVGTGYFEDNGSTNFLNGARPLAFGTGGTERMRINSSGFVGIGSNSPVAPLEVKSSETNHLTLYRPANTTEGNAGSMNFDGNDSDSNQQTYAKIESFTDDPTAGSHAGKISFSIAKGANGITSAMTIQKDAQVSLNQYGQGSYTGTAAYTLQVDSAGNIIEGSTSGGGTVTGSGAATRVAFWSGTSALSSNANLYWDNTNDRLGIGTTAPNETLSLYKSDRPYIQFISNTTGTTSSDGSFIGFANADGFLEIRNKEAQPIRLSTSDTERMRITSVGKVGIGTTSPASPLHIYQNGGDTSTGAGITIEQDGTGDAVVQYLLTGNRRWVAGVDNSDSDRFKFASSADVGTNTVVTINTSEAGGNVGIGTTSPTSKLNVYTSTGRNFEVDQSSSNVTTLKNDYHLRLQASGGYNLQFYTGASATERMVIDSSGDTTFAGDVTIGSSGAGSDKTLNILTGGSKSIVKLMEAGTVYGFSTLYDGATNKFHINRHSNSAAGTSVLSFNRDDDNATFAGNIEVNAEEVNIDSATHATLTLDRASTSYDNNIMFKTAADTKFRIWQDGDADYLYIRDDDNATNMVTFKKGGNVGIGTTSPTEKLHVEGRIRLGTTPVICSHDNIGIDIDQNNNSSSNYFRVTRDGEVTELFRVQENGNVGIGTSTPATELDIAKDIDAKLRITSTRNGSFVDGDNFGSLEFYGKDTSGLGEGIRAAIRAKAQGTYGIDTNLTFSTSNGSTGLDQERMRINSAGAIKFNNYDSTNNTGTPTYLLGTDGSGNIVKTLSTPGGIPTQHNLKSKAYTSLVGSPSSGSWFDIFTITDSMGPVNCKIFTYAHDALEFSVAEGYGPSNAGTITVINSVNTSNSGYATVSEVRIDQNGVVSIKLVWSSGPTVNIGISISGYNVPNLTSTLSVNTSTVTVVDSVNVDVTGIVRSRKQLRAGSNVLFDTSGNSYINGGNIGIGNTSPSFLLDLASLDEADPTDFIRFGANNGNSAGTSDDLGTGIVWKPNYTGYTKRSAGIVQIGEGNYFRSGLGFFTNGTANATTDWSERMRISMDGNVGIGTTSPSNKLTVVDNSNILSFNEHGSSAVAELKLIGDTAHDTAIYFGDATDNVRAGFYYDVSSNQLQVRGYNNGTRMVVNSNGNVGIGTTSPDGKLTISGGGSSTAPTISVINTSSTAFNHSINAFTPNLTSGESNILVFGRAGSTKNSAYIGYRYSGTAGSNDNLLILGHWASDNLMTISGDGKVGIGTGTTAADCKLRIDSNDNNQLKLNRQGVGAFKLFVESGGGFVFEDDGSEKMRIDSSGNVGIGTDNPSSLLHLSSASSPTLRIVDTTNSVTLLAFSQDTNAGFGTFSAHQLNFYVNSSAAMVIDGSQNVGIGLTADVGKLGTVNFGGVRLHIRGSGNIARAALEGTVQATVLMRVSGTTASANSKIKFIQSKGGEYRMGSVDDNGTERTQLSIENNGDTHIEDGSLEVDTADKGLILKSANGNRFRITVDNGGTLTSTQIG